MADLIIYGGLIVAGTTIQATKAISKKVYYKRKKNKLKKKLFKAFEINDKQQIKKYVCKVQDFDKKYNTEKLKKYLTNIVKTYPAINEYNTMNLIKDFTTINELYTSENFVKSKMDLLLEEKLKKIEAKNKEVKLRNDKLTQKFAEKAKKIEKNQPKKIRRI